VLAIMLQRQEMNGTSFDNSKIRVKKAEGKMV
jgi:hypothetical protein